MAGFLLPKSRMELKASEMSSFQTLRQGKAGFNFNVLAATAFGRRETGLLLIGLTGGWLALIFAP
jgi:hypothetical protein